MKTLILALLSLSLFSYGANVPVTLAWDPPTVDAGGGQFIPEPDISHYVLKIGTAPGVYTQTHTVTVGTQLTIQLPEGVVHYAIVTAVNTSAVAGPDSDELAFQPGKAKPPGKPGRPRKVAQVFTIGGVTVTVTEDSAGERLTLAQP